MSSLNEGAMHLGAGRFMRIRNVVEHGRAELDPAVAAEYLGAASPRPTRSCHNSSTATMARKGAGHPAAALSAFARWVDSAEVVHASP